MISIEPVVFTIRLGDKHNEYGDDYDTVCTALKTNENTVRISAMVGKISLSDAIILRKELSKYGITNINFARKRAEGIKEIK